MVVRESINNAVENKEAYESELTRSQLPPEFRV